MKSNAQSHTSASLTPASTASGALAAGKETFTVTFEAIDIEVAPLHMVIEGRPPPSAPPTPTMKQEAAPTFPIRIYLQPAFPTPMPSRRTRSHHDSGAQPSDEDWFASDSTLGAGDGRCEACGAVFASSKRQAFWKHIILNKCRKRQALRGRSHLGQWWSGRKF